MTVETSVRTRQRDRKKFWVDSMDRMQPPLMSGGRSRLRKPLYPPSYGLLAQMHQERPVSIREVAVLQAAEASISGSSNEDGHVTSARNGQKRERQMQDRDLLPKPLPASLPQTVDVAYLSSKGFGVTMSEKISLRDLALAEQRSAGSNQQQEVPDVSVPLPSRGKTYSQDDVLFGAESIDVRAMTAKDENILSSLALLRKGQNLTGVMRACITNKMVDPDALLIGDRNAVLIAIRNVSYGADYSVEIECPSCSTKVEHTFDMSRLPMKMLDADPVSSGTNVFRFVLPRSKKEVTFKLLTGKNVAEQDQAEKARKKNNVQSDDVVTSALHSQVVSIGGEQDGNKLLRLIENMSAFDSLALRDHIADVIPGIDMVQDMTCPVCDASQEVEVPLGPEFFWPARRRKGRR